MGHNSRNINKKFCEKKTQSEKLVKKFHGIIGMKCGLHIKNEVPFLLEKCAVTVILEVSVAVVLHTVISVG